MWFSLREMPMAPSHASLLSYAVLLDACLILAFRSKLLLLDACLILAFC